MKKNEHRLYIYLGKVILDWLKQENKKGRKPYQSEVIGALEMLKMDWYLSQTANRVMKENLYKIFKSLEGKQMEIHKDDGGITIMEVESGIKSKAGIKSDKDVK